MLCYFSTKSLDEFLYLQEMANIEILKAIHETGAKLAIPTTQMITPVLVQVPPEAQGSVPEKNISSSSRGESASSGSADAASSGGVKKSKKITKADVLAAFDSPPSPSPSPPSSGQGAKEKNSPSHGSVADSLNYSVVSEPPLRSAPEEFRSAPSSSRNSPKEGPPPPSPSSYLPQNRLSSPWEQQQMEFNAIPDIDDDF